MSQWVVYWVALLHVCDASIVDAVEKGVIPGVSSVAELRDAQRVYGKYFTPLANLWFGGES